MIAILLALTCGVELWPQKILADPGAEAALARPPRVSGIAELGMLPRGATRQTYVVSGRIVKKSLEQDADVHVIIADDQGRTMVVEFPHPECAYGSLVHGAIRRARRQIAKLRAGAHVEVTGMLFMDRCHRQRGAAPNCAELHPVFDVRMAPR